MTKRSCSIPLTSMSASDQDKINRALKVDKARFIVGKSALPPLEDSTKRNLQQVFERLTWWIQSHAPDQAALPLVERLFEPVLIVGFVDYVLETASGETAVAYCERLKMLAGRIAPERSLKAFVKARRIAAPFMNKAMNASPMSPPEILMTGLAAMRHAQRELAWLTDDTKGPQVLAHRGFAEVIFRNGLIIAFLAVIPLRASDLLALQVTDIVRRGGYYYVTVTNQKTDRGSTNRRKLPAELTPWFDLYLNEVRPALVGRKGKSPALWINCRSRPLKYPGLYRAFVQTIEEFSGNEMNPHRVRHAAATFAHMCGFSAEDAAHVLQHHTISTVQAFYNSAKPVFLDLLVADVAECHDV
ncbi:MAG: site-specific integrase [Phreatobacter sp.]|nr:site-specific integrase [Phreatobacter sp.]